MRFFYLDPGIDTSSGHHANWCRGIVREIRDRGIETRVLAFAGIEPALQADLEAEPFFRAHTHCKPDDDPISGWLNSFDAVFRVTIEDLSRLDDVGPDDAFLWSSGEAAQLKAMLRWLHGLAPERRPRVVFDLGQDPGMDIDARPEGTLYQTRDPRHDPTAILYRFTAGDLAGIDLDRFRLVTMGGAASTAYGILLKTPVGPLPMAQPESRPPVSRAGRRPITVACLGHQRPEKGFHLLPEICRRLLIAHPEVRILIHNGVPHEQPVPHGELKRMAAEDNRIEVRHGPTDQAGWAALLDAADLMLCPYSPERYRLRSSGICIESIAAGIPLVVPSGTYLEREMREFGAAGASFDQPELATIVRAIGLVLANFDDLATTCHAAATRARQTHGIKPFVDALLPLLGLAERTA